MMDHSVEKFKNYMGHLVCVMNQREEIQRIYDDMDSDECFTLMDYKMKFEPQHFRKKITDHYGKKCSFTMVYLLVVAVIQLDTHWMYCCDTLFYDRVYPGMVLWYTQRVDHRRITMMPLVLMEATSRPLFITMTFHLRTASKTLKPRCPSLKPLSKGW